MGAILDRITREGLTEEVTYELRLEGNRGVFQVEHSSCANTLKEEYVLGRTEKCMAGTEHGENNGR